MFGYGYGFGKQRGGSSLLPETKAYIAAMSPQPSAPQIKSINKLIKTLHDGGILSRLDALYIVANTEPNSRINVVNPAMVAINQNSVSFADKLGWTGGSGKWLDLGINLTSPNLKFANGRGTLGCFLTQGILTTQSAARGLLGSFETASLSRNSLRTGLGVIVGRMYADTGDISRSDGESHHIGYYAVSNNTNTELALYAKTARTTASNTNYGATKLYNGNVFGCANNQGGVAVNPQIDGMIGCFYIGDYFGGGSGATIDGEHSIFRQALITYFSEIATL